MANDQDSISGIPITSEHVGFSSGEMIACGKCEKPNPPNRLNCLYCGDLLELPSHIAEGIQFRPNTLETWESGVNIVAVGGLNEIDPNAIFAALAFDPDLAAALSEIEPPIPLLRVSAEEAEMVRSRLAGVGLSADAIDDREIVSGQPLARIKGISFEPDALEFHLFNSGNAVRVGRVEIGLIVSGMIVTTASEAKIKRSKKEVKSFDEHLSSSDHAVIDIYPRSGSAGFRIVPHGFDFSCLGARKSLLAFENVKLLLDTLKSELRSAVFDESYAAKMPFLDQVWPRTRTNTSKGVVRSLFRLQYSSGESTSNEEQFTRYSRMRRKLL